MMDARANRLHGSQATAARGETIALKASHTYSIAVLLTTSTVRACDCESDYDFQHVCESPRAPFRITASGPCCELRYITMPQGLPASPHFITATPPPTSLAPTRIHGRLRSDLASHYY